MDRIVVFLWGCTTGVVLLWILMATNVEYSKPYKQGQIDAINGKIIFDLKENPDGTTEWKRK